MTKPILHPWLSTAEAVTAARRAVSMPRYKMPSTARVVGPDELFSEALSILTECALPPRERGRVCGLCSGSLERVRTGAKYCSAKCRNLAGIRRFRDDAKPAPLPQPPLAHIGSMWTWPEDKMASYAVREVGFRLCSYLRSRPGRSEIANSEHIENIDIPADASELEVREVIEDYLTANGVEFDGTESLEELAEAAQWLQKKVA